MGDAADDAIDDIGDVGYRYGAQFQQVTWWTVRNGERIKLTDMGQRHLHNTMAMLEQNAIQTPGLSVDKLHATKLYKRMKKLADSFDLPDLTA